METDTKQFYKLHLEGNLMKRTTGGLFQYVKRFFILNFASQSFTYQHTATSKKSKLGIHFSTLKSIQLNAEVIYQCPQNYPHGFILNTASHRFVLFTTLFYYSKWVDHLTIAIELYGHKIIDTSLIASDMQQNDSIPCKECKDKECISNAQNVSEVGKSEKLNENLIHLNDVHQNLSSGKEMPSIKDSKPQLKICYEKPMDKACRVIPNTIFVKK